MDGTLVHSDLNFSKIRNQIGIPKEVAILDYVETLDARAKKLANEIIINHELEAAAGAKLIPGAKRLLETLSANNILHAIVTNNSKEATQTILSNLQVDVDLVLTREDFAPKPDPAGLLHISSLWEMSPSDIAYLGDYAFDLMAAKNANMHAWLYQSLSTEQTEHSVPFEELADAVFEHLDSVTERFINK